MSPFFSLSLSLSLFPCASLLQCPIQYTKRLTKWQIITIKEGRIFQFYSKFLCLTGLFLRFALYNRSSSSFLFFCRLIEYFVACRVFSPNRLPGDMSKELTWKKKIHTKPHGRWKYCQRKNKKNKLC